MATIRDMLESEVMPEPQWPRCPRCRLDLVERIDSRTGKPVQDHGRVVMECPQCGDVSIRPSPTRQRRRYTLIRTLTVIGGFFAIAAALIDRYLRLRAAQHGGVEISDLGYVVPLIMAGGCAALLYLGLDAAARALSPGKADVRMTWWAYTVFYAAVLVLSVVVSYKTLPMLSSFRAPSNTPARNAAPSVPTP